MNPLSDAAVSELRPAAALARAWLAAIDAQVELFDALVAATQEQIRALVGLTLRHGAGMDRLAESQQVIQGLVQALERQTLTARGLMHETAVALGLGPASAPRALHGEPDKLKALEVAVALPRPLRDGAIERLSALRSLGQALSELQHVAQAHAQRGLQVVQAWGTVLGVPATGIGHTYSRYGRSARSQSQAINLEVEL
ncbi:MAG: hypothetical protein JNJ59_05285 [Deltaproteobacteria bacterium]|jgi:hypothetical protein|nr:hypothetical protein [Deltaproteobacteria bacterium]